MKQSLTSRQTVARKFSMALPVAQCAVGILLVLLFAASRASAALTNGGFETPYNTVSKTGISGSIANGWNDNSPTPGTGGSIVYSQDTATPHGGSSDQKLVLTAPASWQIYQAQNVTAGKTYTGSVWVKGALMNGSKFQYYVRAIAGTVYVTTQVAPTASWQQISFVFKSTVTGTVWLMMNGTYQPGTLYVDDATFTDVTANIGQSYSIYPSDDVYVQNGGAANSNFNVVNRGLPNEMLNGNLYTKKDSAGTDWQSYLKFPLSSSTMPNPTSAQVWLNGRNNTTAAYTGTDSIHAVPDTPAWDENSLTWNNRPTPNPTPLYTAPITNTNDARMWDVTSDLTNRLAASKTTASYSLQMDTVSTGGTNDIFSTYDRPTHDWKPCLLVMNGQTPSYDPISKGLFGTHTHKLNLWPQTTSGTIRVWDYPGTTWNQIEASPPVGGVHSYDWSHLDPLVAKATADGMDVIMCLGFTPDWATSDPATGGYPGYHIGPPDNVANWTAFVTALAARYKTGSPYGRIKYFELWNEANSTTFYHGTMAQLAQLAQAAYPAIKAQDPTNMVLTPSFVGNYAGVDALSQYLDACTTLGNSAFADIIAFHFYISPESPETTAPLAGAVRTLALNKGYPMPVWNTESGYLGAGTMSDTDQSNIVARSYLVSAAVGIDRFCWYTWDDPLDFVHLSTSTNAISAAGLAYNQTAAWLVGAQLVSRSIDNSGTWIMKLSRDGNYAGEILWNPYKTVTFSIPSTWGVIQKRNLTNTVTNMVGQTTVSVGAAPIILENQNRT